jgi:hypothetical protein
VGYIALFGIAVETGVVMVIYLHEALQHRIAVGAPLTDDDIEQAAIDGAVQRLRPKLMTVTAVILSLGPILWETGIGSDVMKPIAAPIVGGMITSTIHVLILVPVFFFLMKRRAPTRHLGSLRTGANQLSQSNDGGNGAERDAKLSRSLIGGDVVMLSAACSQISGEPVSCQFRVGGPMATMASVGNHIFLVPCVRTKDQPEQTRSSSAPQGTYTVSGAHYFGWMMVSPQAEFSDTLRLSGA